MCGIVGYLGRKTAAPLLLEGLRRLEYRGYDSAGVCTLDNGSLPVRKCVSSVARLAELLEQKPATGSLGISHTRWATHGLPSDANSHSNRDRTRKLALVHNGIIENYAALTAEYLIESLERLPVEAQCAFEMRCRNPPLESDK